MMQVKNFLIKWYLQKIKGLVLPCDLIKYALKKNHDKVAIIDGEREITYGALYTRAKKLANALQELGISKRDKVAVMLYNCQEYFEIRIAAYLTGVVLVPLVWDMELEDIIFILNDCAVKAFIYHSEILGESINLIKGKTNVQNFIEIASPLPSVAGCNDTSYEELLSGGDSSEPKVKIKQTDLASINFSSGTTGRPKGVILLQKNWMHSFYGYILNSTRAKRDGYRVLHVLSFATGGSTTFLLLFFLGAVQFVIPRFNAEEACMFILKNNVNSIFTSPSIFIDLIYYCQDKKIKLPLQNIVLGTEGMPKAKFKEAIEFFGPIIQRGYGMVESLPPLSALRPYDYMKKDKIDEGRIFSVGRVVKGVNLKIIDKEGNPLECGKIGRIILQSDTVSGGYWNNEELTGRYYKNGWFYTNDFGYRDKEGYLYLLGRKGEIIREDGGESIFSGQIEEVLHRHPGVLKACVFCADEGKIIACVSLKTGAEEITPQTLIEFCRRFLSEDIAPHEIRILPNLPNNASGKLNRKKIKAQAINLREDKGKIKG